ncbi:MAG: hypothetical protein ACSHX6_00535 [Akkermansiaceae bacterium]
MGLFKVCKPIDYSSQGWLEYCEWRRFPFTSFDSLDSSLNECEVDRDDDEYWSYCVSRGEFLTDVVNDLSYAKSMARRVKADVVLQFDFLDRVDDSLGVVGYDILDGALDYSLLTNFGNDFAIVNKHLGGNGLIEDREKVVEIHRWFLEHLEDDGHVIGSEVCAVYGKIVLE